VSELPILSPLVSLVRGKGVTVSTAFNTGAFNVDLRRGYQGLFWPGGSSFCNFSCSALRFTESSLSCVGARPPA
jgi:hypothetical protein